MKKILFLFLYMTICYSCNTVKPLSYIGSITTFTANGEILKKYNNVTIDNIYKNVGLNFYDKSINRFIIIGNSVPYIIEYESKNNKLLYTENNYNKDELTRDYNILETECWRLEEQIKTTAVDSEIYRKLLLHYKALKTKKDEISQILVNM